MSARQGGARAVRAVSAAALIPLLLVACTADASSQEDTMIQLPDPVTHGETPLETALSERRSVREYGAGSLQLGEVGQLLWSAQGVTEPTEGPGLRAAPSAGALYPLELYLLAVDVEGLQPGLYHYSPSRHGLTRVGDADRQRLASAALGQRSITDAPALVVMAAAHHRTAAKYGDRARRYVHIEVGAAAENLYLQAVALGLGTVFIGAFRDDAVRETLELPEDLAPLGIMPVGRPQ